MHFDDFDTQITPEEFDWSTFVDPGEEMIDIPARKPVNIQETINDLLDRFEETRKQYKVCPHANRTPPACLYIMPRMAFNQWGGIPSPPPRNIRWNEWS